MRLAPLCDEARRIPRQAAGKTWSGMRSATPAVPVCRQSSRATRFGGGFWNAWPHRTSCCCVRCR
jgi:hypothetical protein